MSLKREFQNLIDECQKSKQDCALKFSHYQERVTKELSQLSKSRAEFDDKIDQFTRQCRLGHKISSLVDVDVREESNTTIFDDAQDSDDGSQEFATTQLQLFHSQKSIQRSIRYKLHEKLRSSTLQGLADLKSNHIDSI